MQGVFLSALCLPADPSSPLSEHRVLSWKAGGAQGSCLALGKGLRVCEP